MTAAETALAGFGNALATVTAGVAGTDHRHRSRGRRLGIDTAGDNLLGVRHPATRPILAEGQAYQTQFETNLGAASDTYSFTESANAAQAAADPGGIFNAIATLLGGPSTSLDDNPFSLSSNAANMINIGTGNWASAGSDLLGLAGGGLVGPIDAAGDVAGAADLAGTTTPVGSGMAGMGVMPVAAVGQATMVGNKLAVPPSWAGAVAPATSCAAADRGRWVGPPPRRRPAPARSSRGCREWARLRATPRASVLALGREAHRHAEGEGRLGSGYQRGHTLFQ